MQKPMEWKINGALILRGANSGSTILATRSLGAWPRALQCRVGPRVCDVLNHRAMPHQQWPFVLKQISLDMYV